jgi:hypothetical protein
LYFPLIIFFQADMSESSFPSIDVICIIGIDFIADFSFT